MLLKKVIAMELTFKVIREPEGGYCAEALGQSIFTQGDTWGDLRSNVREAVEAFYFDCQRPTNICLDLGDGHCLT
jgi:hypothetical protein